MALGDRDSFFVGSSATEYKVEFTRLTFDGSTATATATIYHRQHIGTQNQVDIDWSVVREGATVHSETIATPGQDRFANDHTVSFTAAAGDTIDFVITDGSSQAIVSSLVKPARDFQFGWFGPSFRLPNAQNTVFPAIYHFEHIINDGAIVNAEFAEIDSSGNVISVLCQHGGNFSSAIGDTWALSMAEATDGTSDCGTSMANGIITKNELFDDMPDNLGGTRHYGLKVWSNAEGEPNYPAPGNWFASAVSWSSVLDDHVIIIDGSGTMTPNPVREDQAVEFCMNLDNLTDNDALFDIVYTDGGGDQWILASDVPIAQRDTDTICHSVIPENIPKAPGDYSMTGAFSNESNPLAAPSALALGSSPRSRAAAGVVGGGLAGAALAAYLQ